MEEKLSGRSIAQPTFHCPRWSRCGCPEGTVDPDCPGLETLTIPPGNQTVNVCSLWPECGCDGDCEIICPPRGLNDQQVFHLAMLFVLAVCGLALLWLWVQ